MNELDRLSESKYISISTTRKNGEKIATPVWVTREGNALYVITGADSGKVKRIRNNPHVEVAPCDARGRLKGDVVAGTVEILDADGTEEVRSRVSKRFGLMYKVLTLMEKVRGSGDGRVGLKITVDSRSS
ncbi:MAG: PPOX class F420-dependent oxidoreductase [Candidatus Nanopelagicales bacterium]|nr:PPOX class F420-dependent oxidoreductase [Candidatus Nanopelagicales bacterium]